MRSRSIALAWTGLSLVACGATSPPAEVGVDAAPMFDERAHASGIDFVHFNGMSGELYFVEIFGPGVGLFDYDNDGDLDLYVTQGRMLGPGKTVGDAIFPPADDAPPGDRLFRNELHELGRLTFTDVTDAAGIAPAGYGMGVAAGDYDGDGWIDLYVTAFGPNRLLHNRGDGTFVDRTDASGTQDDRWSTSAAFVDYDADGRLDLYVVNYVSFSFATHRPCVSATGAPGYCGPDSFRPEPDRLLRNLGGGRFADVSEASGVGTLAGSGLGVCYGDFDRDRRLELYVANDLMANRLWAPDGGGRLIDRALLAGCAFNADGQAESSMGVDAGDFDGDGDEDLFVTHLDNETNTLYLNDGRGWFTDVTFERGLGTA
ncbi:MAG TPA: VCBS repeat-containing protein, partial [Candidatus Polarisedimenticolaceae bacterium]|nr:VCBS repeat-containing protein [Candidatus Polarisedimenticolaceae bacterium]